MKLFLSCEHGGNVVPEKYSSLFISAEAVLNSHRGWDIGALEMFNKLKSNNTHYSNFHVVTRLLVDLNRSMHRKSLFSEYSIKLSDFEKEKILEDYYFPFRKQFHEAIKQVTETGDEVFHISVHSFTPELNGEIRNADIGLLFHPGHAREKELAKLWKAALKEIFPDFNIRFNYPYLGKTDGHVAPLRKTFGRQYNGIELELNNKHAGDKVVLSGLRKSLCNWYSL